MKPEKELISLSHVISSDMIAYPGDPEVRFRVHRSLSNDGVNVSKVTLGTHTATHLDAPSHILEKGNTLTDLELTGFFGVARCVRMKECSLTIGPDICVSGIRPGEAVFIDTGHGRLWNTAGYFGDRPCPAKETSAMLIQKKISAIGIDTPGVDMKGAEDKYNHRVFLENGINVYECVANLDRLPEDVPFVYFALPLPMKKADGAPVSILALVGCEELTDAVLSFKKGVLGA